MVLRERARDNRERAMEKEREREREGERDVNLVSKINEPGQPWRYVSCHEL